MGLLINGRGSSNTSGFRSDLLHPELMSSLFRIESSLDTRPAPSFVLLAPLPCGILGLLPLTFELLDLTPSPFPFLGNFGGQNILKLLLEVVLDRVNACRESVGALRPTCGCRARCDDFG